jgi:ribosome maturation factor RimP
LSSLQDQKWAGCPLFVFEGHFTQLTDRIRAIAERVAGSYGLEIFDVQFRREPQGWMLRIFLDVPYDESAAVTPPALDDASGSEGGSVSVDDCAKVSRDVSAVLDVEETIDHHFILEVSSPGLDRPLRHERDYRRFAGRLAKIVVAEAVDNQKHFAGRLLGPAEHVRHAVVIETAPGKRHVIPLSLITRARLDVEF